MNAQSISPVDSILANWPVILAAIGIAVAAILLPGCKSPAVAKAGVQYATLKVIDGDLGRAGRIVDIVSTARLALSNETATSIEALKLIVRSKIDWNRLDAADTALANVLIDTVAEELEARLKPDAVEADPTPWKLKADKVLKWVQDAAELARA